MKKLSVIIPLYNCENYINKAVNSVLSQNGVEIEVVIVNDGSTDHFYDKLVGYGPNVKVLNIENQGASAARNLGLKSASGDYIMFLDSDDFLNDDNVCVTVLKKMEDLQCKVGIFLYSYFDNVTHEVVHLKCFPNVLLDRIDSEELIYGLISNGIVPMTPCCKIMEKEFLMKNDLYFMEKTTAEDIEWFVRLMLILNNFCLVQNDSYMYRKNLATSVTGTITKNKVRNHFNMIELSLHNLENVESDKKKNSLLSALAYQFCIWYSSAWKFIPKDELKDKLSTMDWILNYDLYPGVKYVKWLYKVMGARLYYVLAAYDKLLSKSRT